MPALVWPVLAVEVIWLAGSALLLTVPVVPLTALGEAVLVAGIVAVAAFLVLELWGPQRQERRRVAPC